MDVSTVLPISAAMLQPIETYLNQAVTVAAPIGIGIFALFQGIRFVPRVIKSLKR